MVSLTSIMQVKINYNHVVVKHIKYTHIIFFDVVSFKQIFGSPSSRLYTRITVKFLGTPL